MPNSRLKNWYTELKYYIIPLHGFQDMRFLQKGC